MIWYLSFLTGIFLAGVIIHPRMALSAWSWLVSLFCDIWSGIHRLAMQREPVEREESIKSPRGLGGYVADDTGGGQSNSATLALMKSIEEKIKQRQSVPGYTAREVADGLAIMATAGKISLKSDERTDEIYEEPVAMYPPMPEYH